jgi:ABC-type amino acid transport substrate-binding protein
MTRNWSPATPIRFGVLLSAVLAFAACQSAAAPSQSQSVATPTAAPAASPTSSAAQPSVDTGLLGEIKSRGVLRVANPQTSPPYSFRDASNEVAGFDVDFANDLIKRLEIPKLEFIQGTFDTFIPGIEADKWDIVIAGQAITDERKKKVDFSLPYRVSGVSIFVNAADTSITTLDDLEGKSIAVLSGSAQLEMAQSVPNVDIKTYETAVLALTDLDLGRVDAYLGSRFVGAYLAQESGLKVKPTGEILGTEQNAMSIKQGETAFKAALDDAVRAMVEDGTITDLSHKWFGPSEDVAVQIRTIIEP